MANTADHEKLRTGEQGPVFDPAQALRCVGGDPEWLRELVDVILEEIPQRVTRLRETLAADDLKEAARHAHTIKGQAAYLGAEKLRLNAYGAEMAADHGDLDKARAYQRRVEDDFAELRHALDNVDWDRIDALAQSD